MAYDEPEADEPAFGEEGMDDDRLLRMFRTWDRAIADVWSPWREEAKLAYSMVAGEQWDKDAVADLEEQGIAPITWNRIQPLVDAVSGAQIQNRHEVKFYPREVGDVGVSEVLTSAAEWLADEGDYEDEETDAFYDCLVTGLGWTEMRMDYEESEDGEIKKDRVDPLEMAADASAKKRNLADARYIRRVRSFTKEEFKERWPEWAEESLGGFDPLEDVSVHHTSAEDDYLDDRKDEVRRSGDVVVKEYQWYELEPYYKVSDPLTGKIAKLDEEQFERTEANMQRNGMALEGVKLKRRVFYRAFCAGGKILEQERMDVEAFTYHCITGKRDRNMGTFYGIVRSMVDPQRWANKWMTQILVIINKNAKGGVMVEADAVEDLREFEEDWAAPDAVSVVKTGALSRGAIQPKVAPPYPQGLDRMIQMAISSIRDVTGINQELLGMADKNQPGILEAQRKEAGYAMLSMFFDSLRRYRKISGRSLLTFIRKYISDGRLVRILGNEGGVKYVPLVYDPDVEDYDVIVDEAPSGPNQKDKVWTMFVQMMPMLQRMQIPPQMWAEMIRYSPLPESVGNKFIQIITAPPPPEAQQAQAESAAMQKALLQGNIQKLQSEVAENMADAQQVQADIAQTQADTRLTDAQARHQEIETLITEALAASGMSPKTDVRITT